jgi:FAD synthetase
VSIEQLVTKYISSAEKVLASMERSSGTLTVTDAQVENLIQYAINYLEDAKYYKAQKNLEVSLTSIAYCEGLLDALKLIGAVKFEWPTNQQPKP